MFHSIPPEIQAEMGRLERLDAQDRLDGTPRSQRLRQIPPETGRFLALLVSMAPAGDIVEIGTSAGYSTLWLALGAMEHGSRITTYETLPGKISRARQTFAAAAVQSYIRQVQGDARDYLDDYRDIAFCFIDTEKEIYGDCYELVIPNLLPGGLLVADNADSHRDFLKPFLDRVTADPRVDALVAAVGKGLLICRKL